MTPPKKQDTDYLSQAESARQERDRAKSELFSDMLAEKIAARMAEQSKAHTCVLPPEVREWLQKPNTATMLNDLSDAYVQSKEMRRYIRNVVTGAVVAGLISLLILGFKAWLRGAPLPNVPSP